MPFAFPPFPSPDKRYDQENEAQFRRLLQKSLENLSRQPAPAQELAEGGQPIFHMSASHVGNGAIGALVDSVSRTTFQNLALNSGSVGVHTYDVTVLGVSGPVYSVATTGLANSEASIISDTGTNTRLQPPGAFLAAAVPAVVKSGFRYQFMEVDVHLTITQPNTAAEMFAVFSPNFTRANNGLALTSSWGICWDSDLGANWHFYAADGSTIFISEDLGVVAGGWAVLRLEWGFDEAVDDCVVRAFVDGVQCFEVVADALGPFSDAQINAFGGGGIRIGVAKVDTHSGNAISMRIGNAGGIEAGLLEV